MQRSFLCLLLSLLLVTVIVAASPTAATAQSSFQILEVFNRPNGANPAGNLIADQAGNLYGTTEYGGDSFYGTVFRLSPPAHPGESWTFTTLYSFSNTGDGARPTDGLLLDASGNLYGTTSDSAAGGYGEVFKLSRPASGDGEWTETVLYSFKGSDSDGAYPAGGLIADPAGDLFGTTSSSVFELSPPALKGGQWTFTQLHEFKCCTSDGWNSEAGLARDSHGNLYGTTLWGGYLDSAYCGSEGCGTVFEASPPAINGGAWTERVLYQFKSNYGEYTDGFDPVSPLVLDRSGNLYGNTFSGGSLGGGTVFQLSPPAGSGGKWTENILHNFTYGTSDGAVPIGNLIFDKSGDLYGVTLFGGNSCEYNGSDYGCGTIFELVPGNGTWAENVIGLFTRAAGGARFPAAGLLVDSAGRLYGTTQYGGDSQCQSDPAPGCGVVFELKP